MSVSANTLFHFTQFDKLQGILTTKGFWPKYSLEHFENALPKDSKYYAAHIPMVCFCDLKLTQLADSNISGHTDDFGSYGLGFNKKWGIDNRISPVSYVHESSIAALTIDKIIKGINKSSLTSDKIMKTNLEEILKFIKPYTGYYQNGVKRSKPVNFYDEREWRYIPKEDKYKVFPSRTRGILSKINMLNGELQNKALKFKFTDIRYIIIETENDRSVLINFIDRTIRSKISRDILLSKIISMKEVSENF